MKPLRLSSLMIDKNVVYWPNSVKQRSTSVPSSDYLPPVTRITPKILSLKQFIDPPTPSGTTRSNDYVPINKNNRTSVLSKRKAS